MKFTDALIGWEGSASDSSLWIQAFWHGAIKIPNGKYLLGDAGFPNCQKCLTPYQLVRHHLREWETVRLRPTTKEELFNLWHSQLRNIVERIFGILKTRFRILTRPWPLKMEAQVWIVSALLILHNLLVNIREERDNEYIDDYLYVENGDDLDDDNCDGIGYHITCEETNTSKAKRDEIAEAMWEDYCRRRANNILE